MVQLTLSQRCRHSDDYSLVTISVGRRQNQGKSIRDRQKVNSCRGVFKEGFYCSLEERRSVTWSALQVVVTASATWGDPSFGFGGAKLEGGAGPRVSSGQYTAVYSIQRMNIIRSLYYYYLKLL